MGRKTNKGFFLYPTDKKKAKGPRQLNPEAEAIVKNFAKGETKLSTVRRERGLSLALAHRPQPLPSG